jgi:hypothetical protein
LRRNWQFNYLQSKLKLVGFVSDPKCQSSCRFVTGQRAFTAIALTPKKPRLVGFAVDKRRLRIQERILSAIVSLCGKYDDAGDAVNPGKPGTNKED